MKSVILLSLGQDSLVDKLRLKNAALKIQKKKLQMQLKQVHHFTGILVKWPDMSSLKKEMQ